MDLQLLGKGFGCRFIILRNAKNDAVAQPRRKFVEVGKRQLTRWAIRLKKDEQGRMIGQLVFHTINGGQ